MDLGLADKVVWVTGASGGIGRAVAALLLDEGARVGLHGNAHAREAEAWLAGRQDSERALVLRADVRDPDALERCALELEERFGRIDGCVANAGVWPPEDLALHELPAERLRSTIETNLLGALFTARAFLRALARTGPRADGLGAALVFTGSTAGRFGERNHVDYAASKGALRAAALTLKNEITALDPRGRVNVVEPGWTVTHMARPALEVPGAIARSTTTMALRQLARAADIASAVLFLLSPTAARHVTGEALTVAGGMEGRKLWEPDEIDEEAIRARARDG